MNANTQSLKLDLITVDDTIQSRVTINKEVVADYAERMQNGDKFPAIIVYRDGEKHYLADGFHRVPAARKCGIPDLMADIRTGTRKDAIRCSLESNHTHGLRRTQEDKRRAIKIALKEFGQMSSNEIARICGVSDKTVTAVRDQEQPRNSEVEKNEPAKLTLQGREETAGQDSRRSTQAKKAPATPPPTEKPSPSPAPSVCLHEDATAGGRHRSADGGSWPPRSPPDRKTVLEAPA
jgi:hypothetical protein